MNLSELTAYAEEKYHIREEQKWDDFRSFSVLADPETRRWVALMMRQWDYETGNELCRCDIKCGRQILTQINVPYVTNAFRMRGEKWAGVIFDVIAVILVTCVVFLAHKMMLPIIHLCILENAMERRPVNQSVMNLPEIPFVGRTLTVGLGIRTVSYIIMIGGLEPDQDTVPLSGFICLQNDKVSGSPVENVPLHDCALRELTFL